MNKNIKRIFFVLTLVTLLATVCAVSATDDSNTTATVDNSVSGATDTSSNIVAAEPATTSDGNKVDTKTIEKEDKNLKTQSNHILQSESDFDNLFTSPNSNNIYELTSSVLDGDDITFNTDISKTGKTYIINKEVNIIGNDKTITLNTVSGSYLGNETGSSFIFDNGAAHSTVTDLNFYNTQVIVRNTHNITFSNLDVTVSNQNIGQGIGIFSIRDNSGDITVQYSDFSTTNNGGSSTLVLAAAHHCTITHNTITGTGNIGNLLYLTTYNIAGMDIDDLELNSYNTISYNQINGPSSESTVRYGIALTGHDNDILYNTVNMAGQGITTQWAYLDPATPEIGDNSERYKGNNYDHNILTGGASFKPTNNSTITYNTLNAVTLVENCTFVGNTATSVSVNGKNNYLCNNTIDTLNVGSSATNTSLCNCNQLTDEPTGTTIEVECDDCEYCEDCDDQTDSINYNNKVLKSDDEDVFVFNITEENYLEYLHLNNDTKQSSVLASCFTKANSTYIFYFEYVPKGIVELGFGANPNAIRKSTVKVYGMNNLTLTNTALTLSVNALRFEIGNFTLNYNDYYVPISNYNMLTASPKSYCKEGLLIENITVNCNRSLVLEDNDFKDINPVLVRTNKNTTGVTLNNVTVNMKSEPCFIDWGNANKPYTIPIRFEDIQNIDSNLTITNCVINFNETEPYDDTNEYNTVYGVFLRGYSTLVNNTINIKGSQCVYGIVARGSNNIIRDNTINVECTGYYANGIDVESSSITNNIIENNYINVTAGYGENANHNPHVAYGALILDYSYKGYNYVPNEYSIENISYINNTIICDAGQTYGVEIYGGNNLNISDNNIYLTSRVPMGIGAIGENVTISGNTIITNGTNNATESTVDHLTSRTVGVYTRFTSTGINITNNTINSTSGRSILIDHSNNTAIYNNTVNVENYTYSVEINAGSGNTVTENYLITQALKGDESVLDYNGTDNIIENNIPKEIKEYSINVDTTEFTPGQTATIQATINYGTESSYDVASNITKGKVTFKIDGKTLKDANGKVIYAKVVNGTATIENYTVPDTWKEGSTIQAVYSGSTECDKLTSEKTEITITKEEPTLTLDPIEPATVGSTITLKATITDNNKEINTGKIVFKINGKTVKDANGKVIYAKVVNGTVSVDYTIPDSYKTGNYTITATYIGADYDRLTSESIISVLKT